ncbi:MAG: hypothetical protein MHMPM18_000575 [Marteilia pararefringens]
MTDADDLFAALGSADPTDEYLRDESGNTIGSPPYGMEYLTPGRPSIDCRFTTLGCLKRFSALRYEQMHAPACKYAARKMELPKGQSRASQNYLPQRLRRVFTCINRHVRV